MSNPIEVREINGIQIVKAGKEGPNILFLHPAGQPPVGMAEHISQLAEVGQVIAPNMFDLVSSLIRKGNKSPSFADMVNEFTKLDLVNRRERTGIVATSMGGDFAWEYATQNPKELDWITAASPTGWPLNRSLHHWIGEFIKMMGRHTISGFVPGELKRHDPGGALFLKQAMKDFGGTWTGLQMVMKSDAREQMKDVQLPVDLLWGRKDTMVPLWSGKAMQKILPNATLQVVSELHHIWYMYEPGKVTGPAIQRIKAAKST